MRNITKISKTYFYQDKPLFGLDIGHNTIRIVQLDMTADVPVLKGYGSVVFDPSAIKDGMIVKPELIAKAAHYLFTKELVGKIDTKRAAVSLPTARAFTRAVRLPKMNSKDIAEAVRTEAEQYMPGNTAEQYLDYTKLREDSEGIELFVVAIPRQIVDSYLLLTRMLGLETVLLNIAISANAQLFALDKQSNVPSVLVDFGSRATDITVFNGGLLVTGTIAFGGDDATDAISKALSVTPHEAIMLKSKFGLSSSAVQQQIIQALDPSLQLLIKEVRRAMRYYEHRYPGEPPIGQVVVMGGSANMPGLPDYLVESLRLPVRPFDPAFHIDFGSLKPFYSADHMSYVTAAGLAVTNPAEVFA